MSDRKQPKDDHPVEFDFGYVSDLPKHQQAIAAFYEYARESPGLVRMILRMRRLGFVTRKTDPAVRVPVTLNRLPHVNPASALMLTECRGFPKRSFEEARLRPEMELHLQNPIFGRRGLGLVAWNELFALLEQFGDDPRIWSLLSDRRSVHVITIPWEYNDDELVELFRPVLKRLRPKEHPEPGKPGRKGRSRAIGATDMLRQLAAYRCDRQGLAWNELRTKNYPEYTTLRGWRKANKSARQRITTMMTKQFYGD